MSRKSPMSSSWSLHASHEDLLSAIDSLHVGLVFRSPHGKIIYANERALEWVGYTPEELNGQDIRMLTPPELREAVSNDFEEVLAGDERARVGILRRKNGRTFPVVACPHVLRVDGEIAGVIGLFFDIGELQTAKPIAQASKDGLAANLHRVVTELQTISLFSGAGPPPGVLQDHVELAQMTIREREILAELVSGKRVPAIAKDLFISPHTVRNHLKSMYRKLNLSSQAELIEFVRGLATS